MKRQTFDSLLFRGTRGQASAKGQLIKVRVLSTLIENGASPNHLPVAWWLWPNLLSLDAPLIAGLWAIFLGKIFLAEMNPASILVLMMCVWGVYISDRLLDGFSCDDLTKLRSRHHFVLAHRLSLSLLVALAIATSIALSLLFLSSEQIEAGLVLCLLVIAYLLGVHAAQQSIRNSLPKEYLVGALFAAGTALPLYPIRDHTAMLFTWILFAHLCSLNCLAIECWETKEEPIRASTQRPDEAGVLRRQIAIGTALLALVAITACTANKVGAGPRAGLLGIAAAAILLAAIHINRNRFSAEGLRVLADVALVVPALVGILALANGQS